MYHCMIRSQSLIQVSGTYEKGARPRKAAMLKNELASAKAEAQKLREDASMSEERELDIETERVEEKMKWQEEKHNMKITMEAMQAAWEEERLAWKDREHELKEIAKKKMFEIKGRAREKASKMEEEWGDNREWYGRVEMWVDGWIQGRELRKSREEEKKQRKVEGAGGD